MELGVERLIAKIRDDDLVECCPKHDQKVAHEVVRHWTRRVYVFESQSDSGGFGLSDKDRQHPRVTAGLLQQHDRRIARHLDSDTNQFHCDHEDTLPLERQVSPSRNRVVVATASR